jgi:hypothetical protein
MASADILRTARKEHTPGPWQIEKQGDGARGYWLHEAGKPHAYLAMSCVQNDREVEAANARLICAAPDLLSIAKRWAAIDGGAWHIERYEREREELLADTHAAIAAAEAEAGR